MKKFVNIIGKKMLFLVVLFFLFGVTSQMAQTKSNELKKDICYRWQTQVDPSFKRIEINESTLSVAEVQEGIGCLLKLQGKTNKARFTGATRLNPYASQGNKPSQKAATVEIAALYYISYLFYNNWEHASSLSLYDENTGEVNSKKNVKIAYKSYREWFKKVIEIGLEEARKQKLDPLSGSSVSWS
jgi:hypothetical protein